MGIEGIQDKYINPYTDFGFKLLFGTAMNKELLISFLNALLFKEEMVKDVTYMNTEHLGTQEYDRRAIFDVYCENEKGEKFLVEMQKGEQSKRGEWNYELKTVYTIGSTELSEYWDSLKNFRDLYSVISTAELKGHNAGLEEGIEKARKENALRMKQKAYPLEDIAEITGLSVEVIKNL